MRIGAVISGAAHIGIIALAFWGYERLNDEDPVITADPAGAVETGLAQANVPETDEPNVAASVVPVADDPAEPRDTAQVEPVEVRDTAPEPVAVTQPEPVIAYAPETAPRPQRRPVRVVEQPAPAQITEVAADRPAPREQPEPSQEVVEAAESQETAQETAEVISPSPPQRPEVTTPEPVEAAASETVAETPEEPQTAEATVSQPTFNGDDDAAASEEPATTETAAETTTAPRTAQLNIAELNAIRVGVRKFYVYNGDRSDRDLAVTVRLALDPAGKLAQELELVQAEGGSPRAQRALFQAGRRAVLRASAAGEFASLPAEKHDLWRTLVIRFRADGVS